MKLLNVIFLATVSLLILTTSCDNKKTYAEYLKDEQKSINLFIQQNNIKILESFPKNYTFAENEFYKDPFTGVYFNIIQLGDTTYRPQWREKVHIRFKGLSYFASKDTTLYSNSFSTFPEELEFIGPVNSTTSASYSNAGWAVPLSYIGHKGKAKLIIPFKYGSSYDQSNYQPSYYNQVEYTFESQW